MAKCVLSNQDTDDHHATIWIMESARSVSWEAPEHYHIPKGADWFFALAIITAALVVAVIFFGNLLFAILCGLGGGVLAVAANMRPKIITFSVSVRGIRIDESLYPFTTLRSWHIDEDHPRGPQLLVLSKKYFMPLIVLPIPEEYIDDIEDIIAERLKEEFLEESFFNKLLEFLGF